MALLQGRRPDPPPLETDDARAVAVGTGAWALALVVLLALRLGGGAEVETWWLVMCGYGVLLGVVGVRYCRRRHAAIERDKARGLPRRE
jgi:polyferredoxin